MNKKFTIFYTIFASLIFVLSIFYFGFNLYNDYNKGSIEASKKYTTLLTKVRTVTEKENTNLSKSVSNSIHNLNEFAFIQIKKDNNSIYKYPANFNRAETKSKLTTSFDGNFSNSNGKFTIECEIYLINPASVSYYARLSFLMILIITLITVVMIIYINVSDNTKAKVDFSEVDEILEDNTDDNTSTQESVEDSEIKETETEEVKEEISEPEEVITEQPKQKPAKIDLPYEELKPVDIKVESSEVSPTGLFNESTGIGWQDYLLPRLESELNRAISSEFDLSIFVIKLPKISRSSEIFKNICNYLIIQFQFKDLIFEYKNDCLVAMKINMNLDEALIFSEKLYSDIKNMIQNDECFIGISTRSIRMVSAERLLFEAEEAMQHAEMDQTSPVIAFRVDAEKYRQYFEHNNQ